jgi:voltage-gated potassium channel
MKKIREIIIVAGILALLLLLNILLVYFERQAGETGITSLGSAFWFMIVTLTTVGYGDLTPTSDAGKIIGYIYVFSSLGVLGYLFSTVSNKIYKMMEEKKLGYKGTQFEDHILIIGWNDFSKMVAEEIALTSKQMAIVTNQKDDIDLIYSQYGKENVFVLFSDYQSLETLDKVNAKKASVAFISLKDDSESLMYVLAFKKIFSGHSIVVSLEKSQLKETFYAAGVTYAVARNEIASKLVASYIFEPDVAVLNVDLLSASRSDDDFDVQEYLVTDNNPYLGKDCFEVFMNLKKDYNSVLMGIYKAEKKSIVTNPGSETYVETGDYLLILSNGSSKKNFLQLFNVPEGRIIGRQ